MFSEFDPVVAYGRMIEHHRLSGCADRVVWENLMWLTNGRIAEFFRYAACCDDIVQCDIVVDDCVCELAWLSLSVEDLADFHAELRGYAVFDDSFVYIAAEHMTNSELAELRAESAEEPMYTDCFACGGRALVTEHYRETAWNAYR